MNTNKNKINWKPGDKVVVTGTPHHGEHGEVVGWQMKWGSRRRGLVPVFLPKYPSTVCWWFSLHNLKRAMEQRGETNTNTKTQ